MSMRDGVSNPDPGGFGGGGPGGSASQGEGGFGGLGIGNPGSYGGQQSVGAPGFGGGYGGVDVGPEFGDPTPGSMDAVSQLDRAMALDDEQSIERAIASMIEAGYTPEQAMALGTQTAKNAGKANRSIVEKIAKTVAKFGVAGGMAAINAIANAVAPGLGLATSWGLKDLSQDVIGFIDQAKTIDPPDVSTTGIGPNTTSENQMADSYETALQTNAPSNIYQNENIKPTALDSQFYEMYSPGGLYDPTRTMGNYFGGLQQATGQYQQDLQGLSRDWAEFETFYDNAGKGLLEDFSNIAAEYNQTTAGLPQAYLNASRQTQEKLQGIQDQYSQNISGLGPLNIKTPTSTGIFGGGEVPLVPGAWADLYRGIAGTQTDLANAGQNQLSGAYQNMFNMAGDRAGVQGGLTENQARGLGQMANIQGQGMGQRGNIASNLYQTGMSQAQANLMPYEEARNLMMADKQIANQQALAEMNKQYVPSTGDKLLSLAPGILDTYGGDILDTLKGIPGSIAGLFSGGGGGSIYNGVDVGSIF